MVTEFQPYVGPRPFERTEYDQNRFFGRDDEASELLSRITAHSAIPFYAQSGAGKTSLINAKLTPMLEKAGFEVLEPARVRDIPPEDSVLKQVSNIYVFNILRSWDQGVTAQKTLARMSISEYLRNRKGVVAEGEDGTPRVAIFDQFEELFTSYQERSGDREDFFDQVGAALDEDPLLRVVFAMREDYIAELDPYLALLPEKLRSRYRIERLSEDDALLAITRPLTGTEYSFAPGVAEELVENLLLVPVETAIGVIKVRGESVEPVQLQVVCQTLWENCQNIWRKQPAGKRIITHEYLKTFGDVDQALSTFYESAIARVAKATGMKEGVLRRWFEQSLITSAGTRGTVFRGRDETVGIPNATVDELVNQHIIRAEIRGGSRWYELTHDRFIEPIKASNERWFRAHSGGEQIAKRLEERAQAWARSGRQKKDLINDEGELLVAERWLESTAAADVGYSETLFAFVQASRAAANEKQAKSARRLKVLVAALLVMVVLLIGASIRAFQSRQEAIQSQNAAILSQQEAVKSREAAIANRHLAERQTLEATSHQIEATTQKIIAELLAAKYKEQKDRAAVSEQIARRDRAKALQFSDSLQGLVIENRNAEENYQFAESQSRSDCDKKKALLDNLQEWEHLRGGYEALGDKGQQRLIGRKIETIRREVDALVCP